MIKILDLGCGWNKVQGAIGVDISSNSAADIIWDLNKFPYPFDDNEFGLVHCKSILEHLDDVPRVMEEIHRTTKPNGEVIIFTPHFSSEDAFSDPTHKHFFSLRSFDYLIADSKSHRPANKVKFAKIQATLGLPASSNSSWDLAKKVANKFPDFFERYLTPIFPIKGLYFRLKVLK